MSDTDTLNSTIVYSCSGCSNLAQLCNKIALLMDEKNIAKMSCIAGIGAELKHFIAKAQHADRIIALDGCEFQCSKKCLEKVDCPPDHHFVISRLGLKKGSYKVDEFNPENFLSIITNQINGKKDKSDAS